MLFQETTPSSNFYVVGGTLRRDAPCYLVRRADDDLFNCLIRGKFCFVLTSRQMGKSSLMIRTASRLTEESVGIVILDLTAAGQHLNVEQWYGGLLMQMGSQTGLEDELLDFWAERKLLSPLQRWMTALCEIVLPRHPDRLTIFIDEIDAVRSLPFSTDEFFAGIRELYNRRTLQPELERLTFCLLGVATPSDLIGDAQTTPFNIGHRIELNDFTSSEAAPLARGLKREEAASNRLLKRILYWTNGHPYLTQRLCQSIADNQSIKKQRDVDSLCEELFLSVRARERDDNLLFVRDRLLRSSTDPASLLELYGRIRAGEKVADDETNTLNSSLLLSGIAKTEQGYIRVRNRIYARAFDKAWIRDNLPEAEFRRQQAAYRRGLLRATMVSIAIILAFAMPSLIAVWQRNVAAEQESARRRLLYAAHMNIAAQDWDKANITRMRELIETHLPANSGDDLRGFEWYYFWRLLHREKMTLEDDSLVLSAAFSPNGKSLATAGKSSEIKIWNLTDGKSVTTLTGHKDQIWRVEFSPDGKRLASASWDHTVKIWDMSSLRTLLTIKAHDDKVCGLAFSPDGKTLATSGWDGKARLWEVSTGNLIRTFTGNESWVWAVTFSPDGHQIATAGEDHSIRIWETQTGSELMKLTSHDSSVYAVAYSPDGSKLASGGNNGSIKLWDAENGTELASFSGHSFSVNSVAFSPDGNRLASAGFDRIVHLWNVQSARQYAEIKGHSDEIRSVTFSPDGSLLATASDDNTVKIWNVPQSEKPDLLILPDEQVQSVSFSSDGRCIATSSKETIYIYDSTTGALLLSIATQALINDVLFSPDCRFIAAAHRDNSITLWDVSSGSFISTFKGHTDQVFTLAFTPDARTLASGSRDNSIRLWDVESRRELFHSKIHSAGIKALAISQDGTHLVTGSDDRTLIVWNLATRQPIRTLKGHINEIWSVAFSPDGKLIASGSYDRSIKIWDWQNSRTLLTLRGHSAGVRALAFSPDGSRLASGGEGGTIKLWETATGNELATLLGHTKKITALAFSPDGLTLASTSQDRSARLWRAAQKNEVAAFLNQPPRRN